MSMDQRVSIAHSVIQVVILVKEGNLDMRFAIGPMFWINNHSL